MRPQHESDELKPAESSLAVSLRFESALAALKPLAAPVDRDRLMFLAGQASMAPAVPGGGARRWAWPAAFSAMTALAASLMAMLVLRPDPPIVERIVRVPIEAPSQTASRAADDKHSLDRATAASQLRPQVDEPQALSPGERTEGYLGIRDRVLAIGIESWPTNPPVVHHNDELPISYHDLLESLLRDG